MDQVASSIGAVICRSALELGFSGHCYDQATQQWLGFAAFIMVLVIGASAMQRFGRWA